MALSAKARNILLFTLLAICISVTAGLLAWRLMVRARGPAARFRLISETVNADGTGEWKWSVRAADDMLLEETDATEYERGGRQGGRGPLRLLKDERQTLSVSLYREGEKLNISYALESRRVLWGVQFLGFSKTKTRTVKKATGHAVPEGATVKASPNKDLKRLEPGESADLLTYEVTVDGEPFSSSYYRLRACAEGETSESGIGTEPGGDARVLEASALKPVRLPAEL